MASRDISGLFRNDRVVPSRPANILLPPMHGIQLATQQSTSQSAPRGTQSLPKQYGATPDYRELKQIAHEQNMVRALPAWLEYHRQMIQDINEIKEQVKILEHMVSHRPFDFDDDTFDEKQREQVQHIVTQFHSATNHLQIFSRNAPTTDSKNALKKDTMDLSNAYTAFKSVRCTFQKNTPEQFIIELQPMQLQQQEEDHAQQSRYAHRLDEIEQIANDVQDLSLLFTQLHNLVVEQGTVIDRIDYHIDSTLTHVQEGKKQLIVAEKSSRGARWSWICIIILILMCVAMIIAIVEKHR